MPFGKRSVMETYFDFGLCSVLETVMLELATNFATFIAAIFFPSVPLLTHALSEEIISTGMYVYIDTEN